MCFAVLAGSEKYLALEHCKSMVVLMDVSFKTKVNILVEMFKKRVKGELQHTRPGGEVSEPG